LEVANEAKRLKIENSNKEISLAQCKDQISIKSRKIDSLYSRIKTLEKFLALAQKDLSKKYSENLSLKLRYAYKIKRDKINLLQYY